MDATIAPRMRWGRLGRLVVPVLVVSSILLAGAPAQAASARVTLTVHPGTSVAKGGTGTYAGTTRGEPTDTAVYVEYRAGSGKWFTVAVAKTDATGAYAGSFQSPQAGVVPMRATVHAGKHSAAVSSSSQKVALTAFFFLDTLPATSAIGAANGSFPVGEEKPLVHSVLLSAAGASGGVASETWNLAGRCSALQTRATWYGKDTRTPAEMFVQADGDTVFDVDFTEGNATENVAAPVTGIETLLLATRFENPNAQRAYVAPRVLCSEPPPGA